MEKWTDTKLYDFLIKEFELMKEQEEDDEKVYKLLNNCLSVLYVYGYITLNQYADADQFLKECLIL